MKKKILVFLSYVLVAALASLVTLGFAPNSVVAGSYTKLEQLSDLIEEKFIGETDRTELEDAAAAAMLSATGDRWSYYIPADEYAAHVEQMENAYVGIGITIRVTEDLSGMEVMVVNEGGPAEEAGMQVGDIIIRVEGTDVAGQDTTLVRNLVRGKEGTQVSLTVLRQEEEVDLSVTRRKVLTPVATGELIDGNVGLVTIANFDDRCTQETVAAIETLMAQGAEYLLFDVRNNGGGYAHELVKLLDYLLPEGDLFRTVDYAGKEAVNRSDEGFLDMPMGVLVNSESYSAAEFFAAALSEYEAAVVIGEHTSGKGYFQSTHLLNDGSAVALSIGKYFTPKGISLEGVGITPDVEVPVDEQTASDIYFGYLEPMEDPQILAALEALK